jgi:protein-histidine pros-kinase
VYFTKRGTFRVNSEQGKSMAGKDARLSEETRFAFSSLLDALPDAIVIADTDGNIVDANVQAVGMFGYSRAELLGEPVEMLVPEDVRERHVGERVKYVQRPRVRPMGAGARLFARHKDGHKFEVEINIAPYQSPGGLLVVGAIRVVADR